MLPRIAESKVVGQAGLESPVGLRHRTTFHVRVHALRVTQSIAVCLLATARRRIWPSGHSLDRRRNDKRDEKSHCAMPKGCPDLSEIKKRETKGCK